MKPGYHHILAGQGSGRVPSGRCAVPDRRREAEGRGTPARHPWDHIR